MHPDDFKKPDNSIRMCKKEDPQIFGFSARTKTPLVLGVLLNPVSPTSSTFLKPTCANNARKSFPGTVPPSH
jgi:hypothetical protein